MTISLFPNGGGIPSVIADAVKVAVETTFAQLFGEKPLYKGNKQPIEQEPCVAGILPFVGDVPWTLTLVLSMKVAPSLAHKFTGMEIPFESPDMGDVAGELVNVLAGEVILQLERRRVKAQMSLPTVARGGPLEFFPEKGLALDQLEFDSSCGTFWLRVATSLAKEAPKRLVTV